MYTLAPCKGTYHIQIASNTPGNTEGGIAEVYTNVTCISKILL